MNNITRHTYQEENKRIGELAQRWSDLCRETEPSDGSDPAPALRAALDELAKINLHYTRKENQLFPYLEKHGFTGPSQVMWALHAIIPVRRNGFSRGVPV